MKVKHWIIGYKPEWKAEPSYCLYGFEMTGDEYFTVGTMEVEIEIPPGFDPRPQMIAKLEQQRRKAMADHEALMNVIEGRIASLRAIEHKVTA